MTHSNAPTSTDKRLLPNHLKLLQASAISTEVATARGYYSETVKSELTAVGFSPVQRVVPALVIPVWPLDGRQSLYQIRPDQPRRSREKLVKYETPAGCTLQVDVPPAVREKVRNPTEPLFITEGVRKADSAVSQGLTCVALLGVHGWKKQDEFWSRVPLKERPVYIAFDSDISSNPQVGQAAAGLYAYLESMGAEPHVITLPASEGQKVGLDDYFAAGGTVESLLLLATDKPPSFQSRPEESKTHIYEADENGIVKMVATKDGLVRRQISNFNARIVAETVFTSSGQSRRELEIEADVRGQRYYITISADEFDRMSWPITRLGADAIIYPAYGSKDEVRTAIQTLSPNIRKRKGIDRLGWHEVDGEHVYVHAGGCIRGQRLSGDVSDQIYRPSGISGPADDLSLQGTMGTISPPIEDELGISLQIPPALRQYTLPQPSHGAQLVNDIQASLQLLTIASPRISIPIYSAIWYAAVAEADFSLHLYGQTGTFKSEFVALATQHFGSGLDARHFPANWSSTANYIRSLSAHAGNVLLPVDDFVPTGSQHDIDRSNRAAEDVFRSQGNVAGRGRCYRDGTPQQPEPPRCLTLSTGEVCPTGHSLTARVLMLEVHPGDIMDRDDEDRKRIFTQAQQTARSGAFARVMAAYIHWVASDYPTQRKTVAEQSQEFRKVFEQKAKHARTSDAAAKLLAGLDRFLDFALESGGIDEEDHEQIWQTAHDALFDVLAGQEEAQADEDPVQRYLDCLRTALSTGRAHLKYLHPPGEEEDVFGSPTCFGYQEQVVTVPAARTSNAKGIDQTGSKALEEEDGEILERKTVFTPLGTRIGWKQFDNIYLEPKESLAAVQRLAKDLGQPQIPLSHKSLGKRLLERGILVSNKKGRNVARVSILGQKMDVFHIRLSSLMELHRCEGDSVDEQREELFEEHQLAIHREQQARNLRSESRQRVHNLLDRKFLKLLNLSESE